jgi:hypothetical protein
MAGRRAVVQVLQAVAQDLFLRSGQLSVSSWVGSGVSRFVSAFCYFFIIFWEIKNWMAIKARSWKHLSVSLSAFYFWDHLVFRSPEN